MIIRQVSVEEILPLRQIILRPGYSLEQSRFDGDTDVSTFHLALYVNGTIRAVATYMQDDSEKLPNKNQYRLRGMAVDEDFQGKGLGKEVFREGERILKEKGITHLWFNARIKAVPFYESSGCRILGDEFDIPTVGPHYFMYKEL